MDAEKRRIRTVALDRAGEFILPIDLTGLASDRYVVSAIMDGDQASATFGVIR